MAARPNVSTKATSRAEDTGSASAVLWMFFVVMAIVFIAYSISIVSGVIHLECKPCYYLRSSVLPNKARTGEANLSIIFQFADPEDGCWLKRTVSGSATGEY